MTLKHKFAAVALVSTLTAASFAGGPGDFDSPQTFHPFSVAFNTGANWLEESGDSLDIDTGFSVGGSFYYHFTPSWRAGLSFDYLRNSKSKTGILSTKITLNFNQYLLLANVYYDLRMFGKFVPYVGIGIGMNNIDTDGNLSILGSSIGSGTSESETDFAWAAHAGVNYMMTDQIGLGLGYRFVAFTLSGDDTLYNNSALASVSYHFGG